MLGIVRGREKPVDKTLLLLTVFLLLLGLLTLFCATYCRASPEGDPFAEVKKQLFGVAVGAAAMGAEGETVIENAALIDRGYAHLEDTLTALGADVKRITL